MKSSLDLDQVHTPLTCAASMEQLVRRRALFNSPGKMMRCALSFIYRRLTSNTLCIS